MAASRKWVIANWKMNGTTTQAHQLTHAILAKHTTTDRIVLCPPYTLLSHALDQTSDSAIAIGAQNCHHKTNGAYTGHISPSMLADINCPYVILGHSECREYNQESDALINQKAALAHTHNLTTIICIGESEQTRNAGETLPILTQQLLHSIPSCATLHNTIIAYEPIWAIGTGRTPTLEEITHTQNGIHQFITQQFPHLNGIDVLYGGSVNDKNAKEILAIPSVGGALVGGASLKAEAFNHIIDCAE